MVSIMDVESDRQVCDNRVIVSQSAVSQKSIDLDISLRPIIASASDRETVDLELITTGSLENQSNQPCSSTANSTAATNPYNHDVGDTDLVKRSMKLNLVDSCSINSKARETSSPADLTNTAASSSSSLGASSSTVVTTTAAIIMKHRKLKERTFSDEIGSPKSPAATTGEGIVHCALMIAQKTTPTMQVEVVDDRKALRDALYQGIFHRHRRTIFAVGSFLRMLKSRNSSYNTIRSSSEGEDDTK
ncbi:uncharacterized protein LOC118517185 isoform X3 [Anopheles stephensi]|uniref:uncharacterized protein LOC118505294 isoform X3 n=1 Tax=Anopheles stephensi TaxID=30069 RepID=UPI0007D13434|nr:uncharacterized protein LOC118505294 isoform X3 [Anopheles stephensi]XP_035896791.1 uncharacterized protein LOC118505294 isoform X3 [Anopheles stephensi]XP_035919004.1 uncharacterized protein LOC118517185 isoform X3 [Anopheles stephensi]XP_035919005.1 uncharacterized protein LOC118517185 isoform X3 [Anopheles stephensi]